MAVTPVFESIHLLRFAPGTEEEDVSQVVDGVWSLQYMAAGPICGSAGPLRQFRRAAAAGRDGAAAAAGAAALPPYSHAVLFRYANEATLQRFEQQPRVQLMLGGMGAPEGTGITTLNFRGAVPSELEAIFRRGPEWAEGLELVLALQVQGTTSGEDAAEFLSLTQQLALSSAYGAVQCSYGPCLSMQCSGGSNAAAAGSNAQQQQGQQLQQEQGQGQEPRPDLIMLARFQDEQQLKMFCDCPPVAALLEGDDRIPLRALWSCTLETTPSNRSSSTHVQGGLM